MRAADLIARTLRAHGVSTVFTLSGNQIMPIFDACVGGEPGLVHVRHEASAVFMAEAWAQTTGEPGVALVTAGPGFANALSPLYSARAAETPLLLLSGDSPVRTRGSGAFQELDQTAAAAPFVKATLRVDDAKELGGTIREALATARSGRPGPVHVALPFDVVNATVEPAGETPSMASEGAPLAGDAARSLARELAAVQRPLIITGPHLCRSWQGEARAALRAALQAPVIGMESPRGLKDPALGDLAGLVREADAILLLGKAPDFALGFARQPAVAGSCRFLQLDPDEAILERGRRLLGERLAWAQRADAAASIPALLDAASSAPAPRRPDWLAAADAALSRRPDAWREVAEQTPDGLHPLAVCRAVQGFLDATPNAILVSDGGEFGQWAQAAVHAPRRIINGPAGAIGGAIPYAIGAALADPQAVVVAMTGDGACGFHIAEFDTAVRYRARFIAVVGNDARWNAEHQIQLRDYGPDRLLGCDLLDSRYEETARSFEAYAERVDRADGLPGALRRAAESGKPACINVGLAGQPAPVMPAPSE